MQKSCIQITLHIDLICDRKCPPPPQTNFAFRKISQERLDGSLRKSVCVGNHIVFATPLRGIFLEGLFLGNHFWVVTMLGTPHAVVRHPAYPTAHLSDSPVIRQGEPPPPPPFPSPYPASPYVRNQGFERD